MLGWTIASLVGLYFLKYVPPLYSASPGAGITPGAVGVFSAPSLQVQSLPLIRERLLKATFSEGPIKAASVKVSSAGD